MIAKGSQDYKKAQWMANKLACYMAKTRINHLAFETAYEKATDLLEDVKKLGGFAANVAETVLKSTESGFGYQVGNISAKQAWIIACAAVENGIDFASDPEADAADEEDDDEEL